MKGRDALEYFSKFDTSIGEGTVFASTVGLRRILLPVAPGVQESGQEQRPGKQSSLTIQVAEMLEAFFRGKRISFRHIPVDLDIRTPFRSRILEITREIPYGEVRTYAELARMANAPRAARAAGGALAANPLPVVIPCHRVVATDGRLTGFSAPGGLETKKILLRLEGLEIEGERISGWGRRY